MEKEIWADIPDYEGLYQASNLGRIKGLKRNKIRKLDVWKRGNHVTVAMGLYKEGKWTRRIMGAWILTAFKGQKPCDFVCRHLDGNELNNRIENLKWDTQKNNVLDRRAHNTEFVSVQGKLSREEKIRIQKELLKEEQTVTELAKQFNVGRKTISRIAYHKYHPDNYIPEFKDFKYDQWKTYYKSKERKSKEELLKQL